MQVSVESIGKLERRMQVQVPAERVSQEIATRLKNISRTARLNGFRPGKAPLKVIRQQFGSQIHREVIGELLQSSYAEAVSQKQLTPAGSPRIEPQSMDEGQDLKYVATFEVFPEVVLQPMESLDVERVTAEVTESDIDAMIERLRKQQMKYSAVSRGAANGDKVTIDFDGAIDGVAFAGGKGENVAIVLGEGRMLPELEQGLIGAIAGEKRNVTVNFPPDYRAAELAGKAAIFATEVKTVEEPVLPEVREENTVGQRNRVNERLDEMVSAYGDGGPMKRAYMQNAEAMRQVEGPALEDQAVDWILEHAKVREVKSTFKQLMNFEG